MDCFESPPQSGLLGKYRFQPFAQLRFQLIKVAVPDSVYVPEAEWRFGFTVTNHDDVLGSLACQPNLE
jgi:hypothetical protein